MSEAQNVQAPDTSTNGPQPPQDVPFPFFFENSHDPDIADLNRVYRRMFKRNDFTFEELRAFDEGTSVHSALRAKMYTISLEQARRDSERVKTLEALKVELESKLSEKDKLIEAKTRSEGSLRLERDSAKQDAEEKTVQITELKKTKRTLEKHLAAAQATNEEVIQTQCKYWEGMNKKMKTKDNREG